MDKHLNCFYTYNHSNELIENNLTRAFIVTIRGLSNKTRNSFMHKLDECFKSFDFSTAELSLQNNIEVNPKKFNHKFIITISTNDEFANEYDFNSIDEELICKTLTEKVCLPNITPELNKHLCHLLSGSIPDAWIYDLFKQYCFLIECKKNNDTIYYAQIIRHAYENFGMSNLTKINACIIRLIWYDVLKLFIDFRSLNVFQNDQELYIANNFIQYMSFFGYVYFQGFNFTKLIPKVGFKLLNGSFFNFSVLNNPPRCNLMNRIHFSFNKLNKHPLFQLFCKPS